MKAILTLAILLFVSNVVRLHADCNPDGCWTVTDNSCYNEGDCNDMDGASTGIIFTPSCTGTYYFACMINECDMFGCGECIACVKLVNNSTNAVIMKHCVLDAGGGCELSCGPNVSPHTLQGGTSYMLQVSLKRCSAAENCNSCTCVAKGRVWGEETDCTAW